MSEYSTVQTEIADATVLRRALQDLGLPFEEADGNRLDVVGFWDGEVKVGQFVVRKRHLDDAWCDLGYAWNAAQGHFDAIVDTHDTRATGVVEQVAQRAAYHQVIKTVNEYGMLVESESLSPTGEIQVVVRTF